MKKKILTVLLSVFSISTCLFALTACEPPHEHSYTTQVVSPTCTEQGYTIYTCECGETYTEELPATGTTGKNSSTDNANKKDKKGGCGAVILATSLSVVALAGAGVGAYLVMRKKKEN